jgi:AmmeMemoRadiSam system protein B
MSFILLSGCSPSDEQSSTTGLLQSSAARSSWEAINYSDYLPCEYPVENMKGILSQAKSYSFSKDVGAVIIPHHLVASSMIASALKGAAAVRPKTDTVVIFAPSHSGLKSDLVTTKKGFNTAGGVIKNDIALTNAFLSDNIGATVDDEIVTKDHSASALVPFVKSCFPDSKITVLLFTRNTPIEKVTDAAKAVSEYAQSHSVLLIGSVDFSHGLTALMAGKKDQYTFSLIEADKVSSLFSLSNQYLDSPQAAAGVIMFLQNQTPKKSLKRYDHANALFFLKNNRSWNENSELITTYMIFGG